MVQSVVLKMALTVLTMTSLTGWNSAGRRTFLTNKTHTRQGALIFGARVDNASGAQAGGWTKEPRQIPSLKCNNRNILGCLVF